MTLAEILDRNSFGIYLNANDYFSPAAEAVYLSYTDYHWALPFMEKHGDLGAEAVMCWITKAQHWRREPSPQFLAVYQELATLAPTVEESC